MHCVSALPLWNATLSTVNNEICIEISARCQVEEHCSAHTCTSFNCLCVFRWADEDYKKIWLKNSVKWSVDPPLVWDNILYSYKTLQGVKLMTKLMYEGSDGQWNHREGHHHFMSTLISRWIISSEEYDIKIRIFVLCKLICSLCLFFFHVILSISVVCGK